jgi:F0F1-type ATP synthase membrane subunit b/b'
MLLLTYFVSLTFGAETINEIISKTYEFYVKRIELLVSTILIVLGGLLGLNIYTGHSNLNAAKIEIEEVKKLKDAYESNLKTIEDEINILINNSKDELTKTTDVLKNTAKIELDAILKNEYGLFKIQKTKVELNELLCEDAPDIKTVYSKLTELLNNPDQESINIFSKCLRKFSADKDIALAVSRGLEGVTGRHNIGV